MDPSFVLALTDGYRCSFVDRDMLMRHFGHGVGHLRYERHKEISTDLIQEGNDNHIDGDTSETEESEDEMNDQTRDDEESGPEDGPMDSEDESEEVEDSSSDCTSEGSYDTL